MDNIRVVEYNPKHAESLAKMWNMSADSWGGFDSVATKESVMEENENSGNLNIFIALDGEEAVGYCSFSEYREDSGALYIALLNVRPDYHGKGVGKILVLESVKRTQELNWPRLDLYTWAGNTKAVPLYKKCGFFMEKRDDTTHLMNFIPTAVKTEAVMEYFETIDWYEDSKRNIAIEPDGTEDDNFSYYEYQWEKDGINLKMGFERRGRSLCLIETDDYLVRTYVDDHSLVFGRTYKVYYEIINKSGRELNVSIRGKEDRNIRTTIDKTVEVKDNQIVEGKFFIDKIEEEQSHWRTHPCVSADVYINGKNATLGVGVEPLWPAKVKIVVPDKELYSHTKGNCYIDIENSFNEEAEFELKLPNNDNVEFTESTINLKMKPNERNSIKVPYLLKDNCFYSEDIEISIKLKTDTLSFNRKLSGVFRGSNGKFSGETDEHWLICNGNYVLRLKKFDNDLWISNFQNTEFDTVVIHPRLGMPFSLEFAQIKPYKVTYYEEGVAIVLRASYESRDFKGIGFDTVAKLYPNGITEIYYEVHNLNDCETENDVWISHGFFNQLAYSFMPYEGKVVKLNSTDSMSFDYWESNKITENWMFGDDGKLTRGVSWPENSKVKFNFWFCSIDTNLGKLKGKESRRTESSYIAWNTFKTWQEFRSFALKNDKKSKRAIDRFEFKINEGNPFVRNSIDVGLREYRRINFDGRVKLTSRKGSFSPVERIFGDGNAVRESTIHIGGVSGQGFDVVDLDVDFENTSFVRSNGIFRLNGGTVGTVIIKDKKMNTYVVDNGAIRIKGAPEFSNTLYSLEHNGVQWLDSQFPMTVPKSWWNDWMGGIGFKPQELKYSSILEEGRKGEFVEITDNYDNQWTGIKLTLKIEKNKKFKGLEINQYFLMLPNLPLLCTVTEINQNTGVYISNMNAYNEAFFKMDDDLKETWFVSKNTQGEATTYKGGRIAYDILSTSPMLFGGDNRKERILVYNTSPEYSTVRANKDVISSWVTSHITGAHGSRITVPPIYYIFTEENIDEKLLEDLKNVEFFIK